MTLDRYKLSVAGEEPDGTPFTAHGKRQQQYLHTGPVHTVGVQGPSPLYQQPEMEDHTIKRLSDQLSDELESRRELNTRPSGRALIISWVNELSAEWDDQLESFGRVLRDDYHYTIDRFQLAKFAQRELLRKVRDLLQWSEAAKKPTVIYYHGDVCEEGDISWVSQQNRRNRVSWAELQRLLQQSSAEVLVFIDRQQTLSQDDLDDDENSGPSFQKDLPFDCVRGKLEVIRSNRPAATDAFPFILQLSRALHQSPDGWYNAQNLARYLEQREGLESIDYENLSSPGDGESLVLVRIAKSNVTTFIFDITVTTSSDEAKLSKQIYDWCLSSPPAVRAMSLSTHRSAKKIEKGQFTNLLTLRVEALKSESTISSLAQWSKQAPDRLLVSTGSSFRAYAHEPATQLTKSTRVSNDLTAWVEQRNQSSELTAASLTRQGDYRRVLVLPIRWEYSGFDAKGEIGLLCSVLKEHFNVMTEAELVLQSNGNAQSQLENRLDRYIGRGFTDTLASQDLLVVIYNGHGDDGFQHRTNMIFAPGKGPATVKWSPIARVLDHAACDVLQIIDCCFAATATKTRGNRQDADDLLDSLREDAETSEYRGTNEYLASSSRDNKAHAGKYSSMVPFADELRKLAKQGKPFTVQEWYHCIDTEIVERNAKSTANTSNSDDRETRGYSSPAYKLQPKERLGHSIILKPKNSDLSQQQDSDAEGYVYARVKLVNGHETETVYFTKDQMRQQLP